MSDTYNTFEDFILEDSFRDFVRQSSRKAVDFWENWIKENPVKEAEFRKAIKVMLVLSSPEKRRQIKHKQDVLKDLLQKINKFDNQKSDRWKIIRTILKTAALLLFVLGFTWMGYMLYKQTNKPTQTISYNEIIVPVGEKSQIILSDGTHVWINSGSRFKYPLNFGEKTREVMLEGEAYFDVTKGRKTFTVSTHDARIRVLGTAFNVKAYPEDRKTQTTVVRGLVKVEGLSGEVKSVLVGPDQMVDIRDRSRENENKGVRHSLNVMDNVNSNAITSWKDQLLVFSDETFEDIAIKMERWFNVSISIEDESLKKERYTGKFINNETVYQVLEAIKITTPITYHLENNEIRITKK